MTLIETEYEGWKNYDTWNVALWIANEYGIYLGAVAFMKGYQGENPYKDFCIESGLDAQFTPDKVKWVADNLDYTALNAMMLELVE